ncbi:MULTISPECIES: AAA family ATPase [unclassified Desulfovibrio]|uniref:MinD/ParA family ATP-binding protein n=1 Tax=unclassified Desulfovibrio TaxID=2593640 RepID=UPI0013EC787E|nr:MULTISPECIES: AAA family ATPase [unclassified Desulfovibrio]
MISYDDVLKIAKTQIKKWYDYHAMQEVTLIRDVLGRIAVLISHFALSSDNSLEILKNDMKNALGHYFTGIVYHKEKINQTDVEKEIIKKIEILRNIVDRDQNCTWYMLERTIAKKAWLDQPGDKQPIWDYEDANSLNKPRVISYYSFKGGMGRTTALVASALLLAKARYNVLIIDTDVEAPGLANIFFDDSSINNGTVDYFVEYQASNSYAPDMLAYILEVTDESVVEETDGKIFLIPAGQTNDFYLSKLARIDYQDIVEDGMRKAVVRLIEQAVDFLQEKGIKMDYILMDARAGFHDLGGVITFQIPHGIVLVGRDTRQSWQGLNKAIALAATTQKEPIPFVIVDNMCEEYTEKSKKGLESFKSHSYASCCDFYYLESEAQPGPEAKNVPHSPVYVPYSPVLKEEIFLFSDGSQEKTEQVTSIKNVLCNEHYQELVERIHSWFENNQVEGGEQNG